MRQRPGIVLSSRRTVALLTVVVLIGAACSGSSDPEPQSAAEVDGVAASISTSNSTREVTQVVVIGADADSLDAIRIALADYDVGPVLEQVMILGESSCSEDGDDLVVCRSGPEPLEPTDGRRVLVVLDGDVAAADEAAEVIGDQLAMVLTGEPDEEASALAGVNSAITFVPGGLSDLVTDPVVTFLVGVNDALAAFEPVVLGDDLAVSRVIRFFDTRLQEMVRESLDTESPQGAVPEPDMRWVLDLPEPTNVQATHERAIVVDDVVAFLGNDGVARGVDTENGMVLWSRRINSGIGAPASSFVSASGETLLVGSTAPGIPFDVEPGLPDRSLWALDIRTGDAIWEVTVPASGSVGHPATDGERVFVWMAEDGDDISFRALDLADGTEVWRTEGAMGVGPPRVDGGEVWTGSGDGALRGFDAQTGDELVRFDQIGLGVGGVASRPAITEDRVLFGNDNGTFYAIDRTTGDLVWSFATESPNLPSSPVIADDLVVFGSFDGGIYGLDLNDGELRWRYDSGEDRFLSSAAVADDTVYIASFIAPTSLLALDARTGEAIWELPIGDQTGASPFIDGETLYIQTPERFLAVTR